ncbi:MAG: TetR/AcrR family transcriptional regulator [Alcanivoracaceae bacterium]
MEPSERVAIRRQKILDAALELFGTQGYQATTMAMLSVESGVPHRYLIGIFPGREDILRELYQRISDDVKQAVMAARAAAPATPAAMIRHGVGAACHAYLADPRKTRVNCLEVVGVSAQFEILRRQVIRDFGQVILDDVTRFSDQGLLPAGDYQYGAIGLVGAFHELMTEWVLTESADRPPVAVLAGKIAEFFWGSLLAVQIPLPPSG